MRAHLVWVGFINDKPDLDALRPGGGISTDGYAVLYRTRKQARRYYQDVRKVVLLEVHRGPISGRTQSKESEKWVKCE